MKYLTFVLLLACTSFLPGQSAILLKSSGQRTDLPYQSYLIKAGELKLLDDRGETISVPAALGDEVLISDRLRFALLEYADGKLSKSGLFQKLNLGSLEVFDFGKNGLLVREPDSEKLRLIPLSSNKPVLTFLLKNCRELTAESLEKRSTNGLKNLLQVIHEYNECVGSVKAEILFEEKVYASKFQIGPLLGGKVSTLNDLDGDEVLREAAGSHFGPVVGLEIRKKLGRSPLSLRSQFLLRQVNIKNDSLPITFNNNTFEKYELKSLDIQLNILAAYHFREEGFLHSLMVGFSPRYNLNFDLTREVFGTVILTNEYQDRKPFGIGIVGGVGLYEKKLRSGGVFSLQAQVDSYKQFLDFSDGSEIGYREVKYSVLAGYLF